MMFLIALASLAVAAHATVDNFVCPWDDTSTLHGLLDAAGFSLQTENLNPRSFETRCNMRECVGLNGTEDCFESFKQKFTDEDCTVEFIARKEGMNEFLMMIHGDDGKAAAIIVPAGATDSHGNPLVNCHYAMNDEGTQFVGGLLSEGDVWTDCKVIEYPATAELPTLQRLAESCRYHIIHHFGSGVATNVEKCQVGLFDEGCNVQELDASDGFVGNCFNCKDQSNSGESACQQPEGLRCNTPSGPRTPESHEVEEHPSGIDHAGRNIYDWADFDEKRECAWRAMGEYAPEAARCRDSDPAVDCICEHFPDWTHCGDDRRRSLTTLDLDESFTTCQAVGGDPGWDPMCPGADGLIPDMDYEGCAGYVSEGTAAHVGAGNGACASGPIAEFIAGERAQACGYTSCEDFKAHSCVPPAAAGFDGFTPPPPVAGDEGAAYYPPAGEISDEAEDMPVGDDPCANDPATVDGWDDANEKLAIVSTYEVGKCKDGCDGEFAVVMDGKCHMNDAAGAAIQGKCTDDGMGVAISVCGEENDGECSNCFYSSTVHICDFLRWSEDKGSTCRVMKGRDETLDDVTFTLDAHGNPLCFDEDPVEKCKKVIAAALLFVLLLVICILVCLCCCICYCCKKKKQAKVVVVHQQPQQVVQAAPVVVAAQPVVAAPVVVAAQPQVVQAQVVQ